jgi:hypothetical protein
MRSSNARNEADCLPFANFAAVKTTQVRKKAAVIRNNAATRQNPKGRNRKMGPVKVPRTGAEALRKFTHNL